HAHGLEEGARHLFDGLAVGVLDRDGVASVVALVREVVVGVAELPEDLAFELVRLEGRRRRGLAGEIGAVVGRLHQRSPDDLALWPERAGALGRRPGSRRRLVALPLLRLGADRLLEARRLL